MYDDPLDEATEGLRAHEARRVVEAVVMAATDPVEPGFLVQLVELPVTSIEQLCRDLADEYEVTGRGALRAGRTARTPLVACVRDTRDRRVQGADLPRADLGYSGRGRRERA